MLGTVPIETYGDASRTLGGRADGKYILAVYRSDADLAWVGQVRAALSTSELKYKQVDANRPRLHADKEMWRRLEQGVGQATIFVIDPSPVHREVREALERSGARDGVDYDRNLVFERADHKLIEGTPLAWLDEELSRVSDPTPPASIAWDTFDFPANDVSPFDDDRHDRDVIPPTLRSVIHYSANTVFPISGGRGITGPRGMSTSFSPQAIYERLGRNYRATTVFAARAHSLFDVAAQDELATTRDVYRSPLAWHLLRGLLVRRRTFDNENPRTVTVLNEAGREIARAVGHTNSVESTDSLLVREADSRSIDHLQAADIAAGWARDLADRGGLKVLATSFERLWINGDLVKALHR